MKFLILFLFLSNGPFTITPMTDELDISAVPGLQETVIQPSKKKQYINVEKRDQILRKHLGDNIRELDSFDRDILYKSILNYDEKRLIAKYKFLNKKNIKELKDAF